MKATVLIDVDGTVRFVYADELADLRGLLGEHRTRRASLVEPLGDGWVADMRLSGGPVLGPFPSRALALAEEVDWLIAHGLMEVVQ